MVQQLPRRRLLTWLAAIGGGALAAQYVRSDGDADAMLPAGGGGGELSGGETSPDELAVSWYVATSRSDIEAASGAVTVVTGDRPGIVFGGKSMQEIDPRTYQTTSWDYDASSIEPPAAVLVTPDDETGGIEYHA